MLGESSQECIVLKPYNMFGHFKRSGMNL